LNHQTNSLRFAYLYEGLVTICKTNQPINNNSNNNNINSNNNNNNNFPSNLSSNTSALSSSGTINLKNLILNQAKYKQSKRYVFLFDGLLIFTKRLPPPSALAALKNSTNQNGANNMKQFRFKQALTLDRCYIKDREDECCFELHILPNSTSSVPYYLQDLYQNSSESSGMNSSGGNLENTLISQSSTSNSQQQQQPQNQEYILFVTNTSAEKYQWMAMLCYSQYKTSIDRFLQTMTEEHNQNNPLPIPPKNYLFNQPDTPESIIFDSQDINNNNNNNNNNNKSGDAQSIRAATLIKLVERLTHNLYRDQKFSTTFLMFFREFTNPRELLNLLSQRYDVPSLDLVDLSDLYDFNR
jgi:hypothetical protein